MLGDLAWLLGAAGLVRLYIVLVTFAVKGDSAGLVGMAQDLDAGRYGEFLAFEQHPLFSVLVAFFHLAIDDWVLAGQAVGWLATTLTVPAVYLWCRRAAGRQVGLAAGVLVAVHPELARFSGAVLAESVYFLFFATSLWLGLAAAQERRRLPAVLAGGGIALAYLSRPEGVVLLPFLLVALWFTRGPDGKRGGKQSTILSACVVGGYLLLAFPYIAALSWGVGYPKASNKKYGDLFECLRFKEPELWAIPMEKPLSPAIQGRVEGLLASLARDHGVAESHGDPHAPGAPDRWEQTLRNTYYPREVEAKAREGDWLPAKFVNAMHGVVLALVALGLLPIRGLRRIRGEPWLAGIVASFAAILLRINHTEFYISTRHALSMAVPCLAWAGRGLLVLAPALVWVWRRLPARIVPRPRPEGWFARRPAAFWAGALVTALLAPLTLKPQDLHARDEKEIGKWLGDRGARGRTVMSSDGRVSFYAGAEYCPVTQWGGYAELLTDVLARDVAYVVSDPGDQFKIEHLVLEGWLVEVWPLEGEDLQTKLRVFRVELK
ncbi:MAG: glycosyltransferase family 39 protein [Planctomycetes bacterium]|nr:glycosyltransferase family 39 protein [Planctomycetota bacterium]